MKTHIRAHYLTESSLHKNQGQPGRDYERSFASLEDAKDAPIPNGVATVIIFVEAGRYTYSPRFSGFGWEFHENPRIEPAYDSPA